MLTAQTRIQTQVSRTQTSMLVVQMQIGQSPTVVQMQRRPLLAARRQSYRHQRRQSQMMRSAASRGRSWERFRPSRVRSACSHDPRLTSDPRGQPGGGCQSLQLACGVRGLRRALIGWSAASIFCSSYLSFQDVSRGSDTASMSTHIFLQLPLPDQLVRMHAHLLR